MVKKLKSYHHYIAPHSDKHLLYNDWGNRDLLLVTRDEFITDLRDNYLALNSAGICKNNSSLFLPPYEWYSDSISVWARE